ncbi:MAG TPA: CTP synthase [Anaerolineae bacterium]|mgnify:CR=1 FL=1|nr:CTP synthase [Anaerolineae bacterium]HQH38832.1 CTP synthase [Anaerolineae bacterium]
MATKYIFVTGGVVSSLGKGIMAASLGRILKARGLNVSIQKLDPYLNVDPGTMAPYQHGEVFVTEDGAETDLDLGHYERFIDDNLGKLNNVTTGQVYSEVIARERRGDFLGGTIQVVPHVTNEIKRRIVRAAQELKADVALVEIGGTVGDIEGQPYLEAIRQMRKDVGRDNVLYVHVTLLPYLSASGELKTKPTQHSVRELRGMGIQPDIIALRADFPIDGNTRAKVALFCDVEREAVIPLMTVESIYEIPLLLEEAGLGDLVVNMLHLHDKAQPPDLRDWQDAIARLKREKPAVRIALVGKYVELHDAYISVREALIHAGLYHGYAVDIDWIHSETLEHGENIERLLQADGIVVPGGFGSRGVEGKILAAKIAREHQIPYLGLCLGMQVMCIELARHVLQTNDVNSTEFEHKTQHPVIALMPNQEDLLDMGGTMRLGRYPCELQPGTKAHAAYGVDEVYERHRHRFEFNNAYREILGQAGMVFSGLSPDNRLVEIAELRDHPWMLGCQFHPEFKTRLQRPHPLFRGFVEAAIRRISEERISE